MLSCKAVQKCLAVYLLHKEMNNEQKRKQRSSGGGKSTTEVYTENSYDNMCA